MDGDKGPGQKEDFLLKDLRMSKKSSTFAAAKVNTINIGDRDAIINGFIIRIIDDIGPVYVDDEYHGDRVYRQGD